ncbi:MAG TPA: acetyl-CoA carboxylase biotin carboxyl carrier protein [Opitutaceae bacterium]|nr:acetyl-CoA carboxylase biotin carboxyl carrier protein [Opitutaceae bacterium]
MDLKQIKQVIDLMKRSDLSEFEVEDEKFKLRIRRSAGNPPAVQATPLIHAAPVQIAAPPPAVVQQPAPSEASLAALPAGEAIEPGIVFIKSPMVGTFYRTPSPESPPFVDINSKVTETSVVCIIEAMKIMNEIQAEVKGTIVEVLLESGQPVEYGQKLFKVRIS